MKPGMYMLLAMMLSGCSIEPYTHAPTWTGTDWYSAGKDDALSGAVVKEDSVLAALHSDADVDRPRYLQGYNDGLKKICHDDFLYAWGRAGKIYPTGCDTQGSATQLRSAWQAGMKEGSRDAILN